MKGIDDRAHAQDIGQQDEFLAQRGAGLAHGRQELDALDPFLGCQFHLPRKGMQMTDGRVEDLFQARIFRSGHLAQRFIGYGEFV